MANISMTDIDVGRTREKQKNNEKWSARKTLAFIVVVCSGFWLAVGFAVAKLFF